MRVFISQPMSGKNEEQILDERMKAADRVADIFHNEEVICVEGYMKDLPEDANELYVLSKSLETMSKCDLVVFVKGYESARGCKIEHECAKQYGCNILYL